MTFKCPHTGADEPCMRCDNEMLVAENQRLRRLVNTLETGRGVAIGVNDMHGRPIHIGDTLVFDEREWGAPLPPFVIEIKKGLIQHPGSTGDLSSWCEIIETWDGKKVIAHPQCAE